MEWERPSKYSICKRVGITSHHLNIHKKAGRYQTSGFFMLITILNIESDLDLQPERITSQSWEEAFLAS